MQPDAWQLVKHSPNMNTESEKVSAFSMSAGYGSGCGHFLQTGSHRIIKQTEGNQSFFKWKSNLVWSVSFRTQLGIFLIRFHYHFSDTNKVEVCILPELFMIQLVEALEVEGIEGSRHISNIVSSGKRKFFLQRGCDAREAASIHEAALCSFFYSTFLLNCEAKYTFSFLT